MTEIGPPAISSGVAKGFHDCVPCLIPFAALISVSGEGERRPFNSIFFPVPLMRLKNVLKKERLGCCGLNIGYSLRDEGFQDRRAYEGVSLYIELEKLK